MKPTPVYLIVIISLLFTACTAKQKPITKEEAVEFARQITKSIENEDPRFLNNAIDFDRIAAKMKISSSDRKLLKDAWPRVQFGEQITNVVTKGGLYSFMRAYEKDGVQHLLFRLYQDGSLNYHDMELTRVKGKCKIGDLYVYLSGENFSETLRSIFDTMFEERDGDKWMQIAKKISVKVKSGEYAGAKELFATLPPNIQSLQELETDELIAAMEKYKKSFPNEPNIPFLMINVYVLTGEYTKLREAIDELDKQLGTDPILDLHRGNSYLLEDNKKEFRTHIERLVKNMPDFPDGLYQMAYLELEANEFEKAKPYIDKLKAMPRYDQEALHTLVEGYPAYTEKYGN